jgi:AraC-like DNA-binding protein
MEYHLELSPEQIPEFSKLVQTVKGSPCDPVNDSYQILHPTRDVTLIATKETPLRVEVFGEEVDLNAGEVLFLNRDVLYLVHNPHQGEYYEVRLPKKIISFWSESYMERNDVLPVISDNRLLYFVVNPEDEQDAKIIENVHNLINLYYSNASSNLIYRLAVSVVSIYADLLAIMPDVSDLSENKTIPKVMRVVNFIEMHYGEPLTQTQLAATAGVRIAVLDHAFQEYVHCSPVKYLIRYRLFMSTHLLKTTRDKVQDISHDVGFNAPSSFILQFKKEFGRTPKDYRALYQQQKNAMYQ